MNKETLRHAALRFLALRQAAAFTPGQARLLMKTQRYTDFDFSEKDLADAFIFLCGLGHSKAFPDAMGSTIYYQATSAGVLAHERHAAELGLEEI